MVDTEPSTVAVEPPAEWDSKVLAALYQLAFATPDREVAGVLVGSVREGPRGGLPVVQAAIPATQGFAPGQAALFSHQTWAQVYDAMARHYRGLEAVGWYVSRPGQGTGLTDADIANHGHWFSRRDQILLMVDSRSHRAAIYVWSGRGLVRLTEGPVARRYTRPARPGFPYAGVSLLSVVGMAAGAIAFLVSQVIGG